jgi:hypothetical protein
MIYKDKTNPDIERMKQQLNLTGDVYIYNEHSIESLESHKNLIHDSTALTIEQAYEERVQWEQEQAEKRRIEMEKYIAEHPEEFEEE